MDRILTIINNEQFLLMNFTYWDSQQNEENNEKMTQLKQLKKKG